VGARGTPEDTASTRFGTVRPRVQIPGPRPFLYSKSAISEVVWSRRITAGSHFLGNYRNLGVRWWQSSADLNSLGSNLWLRGGFTLKTQRAGP
jgi:hypothetical protein